jgi:zinc transport system permease protein
MDSFFLNTFLAGLAVVCVAGPLGSFMVWRRMAYFGDTLSHSAWLGVAIGLMAGINVNLSILLLCLAAALLMFSFQGENRLGNDTLLGILAHTALALGMIILSFVDNRTISIEAYLFGDILAVNREDIQLMWLMSITVLVLLIKIWKPLLSLSVHKELAYVEGVNVGLYSFLYLLMLASLIAVAIKIVGVLLITALMIIPAATARYFAKTPEQMVIIAALIGVIALLIGLLISLQWDIPTGPSIVASAASLFLFSTLLNRQSMF